MIGKFTLGSILKNAGEIEKLVKQAQDELADVKVHGQAGGDMVNITSNAQHQILKLDISDELYDELFAALSKAKQSNEPCEFKQVFSDLIKAAMNDTNDRIRQMTQDKLAGAGKLFENSDLAQKLAGKFGDKNDKDDK